ncbi:MAG: site-2 protease family protein [Chloroflexota bacterium]
MLNESSGLNEVPVIVVAPAPVDTLRSRLRTAVEEVFFIDFENDELPAPITASYTGQLTMDSVAAYERLDALFEPLEHVPVFLMEGNRQVVRALRGRFKPAPRPVWPNVVLLVLTIVSLLYVGATTELQTLLPPSIFDLLRGWPYALGVMLILGTHELGHYFAARYHKVAVTLPYFIPMPLPGSLGTMGAFIQLREPMRNRRILLDIGAAGPLAGLIVAIPVLLIGLRTSSVLPMFTPLADVFMLKSSIASYGLEGNSILYAFMKIIAFGHFLPDGRYDVFINQLASAGWTGLLVTAINLIPVGQLDGGHIIYSLIGERARILFYPLLVILGALSLLYQGWILWMFLLFILGRIYATPLDTITMLDRPRQIVAVVALVAFVLVFMPIPIQSFVIGQ